MNMPLQIWVDSVQGAKATRKAKAQHPGRQVRRLKKHGARAEGYTVIQQDCILVEADPPEPVRDYAAEILAETKGPTP